MESVKVIQKKVYETMKGAFGYTNAMQAPRLTKVVVSAGVGSVKDKKKMELIVNRLEKITGQKPAVRGAKKSIAAFKVRQNDPVGYQITLRGARMFGFMDKLLNVAIPRTRDFRGLSAKAIDSIGNYTLGIKDHTIFPETGDEEIKDIFGLAVTVVTTAPTAKEAKAFLDMLGFPFKKEEEGKK